MSSPGQSIAREDGIVYARHDDLELAGDLYLPAGAGPHPIVLAVPGGAWRFGQRGGLRRWAEYLAAHGHAVFSIDYRQAFADRVSRTRRRMSWRPLNI